MINWFSRKDKKSIATIYPTNITINKTASDKLSESYAAKIGMDEETWKVYLLPMDKDEYDSGKHDKDALFVLSGGKSYSRISSTEFVNTISEVIGYDFKQGAKKYECEFDDQDGYVIINLKKEVNV